MSTSSALKGLEDSSMITVVGQPNPYPYGKVKDAVLLLGGDFYFRNDETNLVRVKDPSGKKKFFRKKSKLVVEISPGQFVHKSFLIKTKDGIYLDKNDPNTVIVNGEPTRREYAVLIDGQYYLKTDPQIKTCRHSGNMQLMSKMIQLNPLYYKDGWIISSYAGSMIDVDGGYILPPDSRLFLNKDGEEVRYHYTVTGSKQLVQVFHKFRDITNPQLDRIDFINMFQEDQGHTVICEELGVRVHKSHIEKVLAIYNDVIVLREATATAALKAALKYADDGPDENQAKVVKKIPNPWPGKYNIYTPTNMGHVISKSCSLTGGLKYTYGLEIETTQGLVPNEIAEKLKLKIVGDRSIGAGEYVTGVLHGDDGIRLLEAQCRAIAKYCLVDDTCGVHAHIGGMEGLRGVAEGDFGRQFCQYAVSLGAQIEPALFSTCPPSRKPTLKHCHSIMRWKDINDENWREYLGAFVFGHEENWAQPWSFEPFKYGKAGFNKQKKLGEWCGGRYKWLNLVHILSKSNINTCELRLFPGSTNFEKIYNYLMLSMAFVWFVENKMNRIVKGDVTLDEVLMAPFEKKYPEIGERLVKFYTERAIKFDRKNLYPKTIPKAIF